MSQQINLLRPKDRSVGTAIMALAACGLFLLVMLGYLQSLRMENGRLRETARAGAERTEQVKAAIKAVQERRDNQAEQAALSAEIAALRPKADAVAQLVKAVRDGSLGTPKGYARYYEALASVSVEGVWVTGLAVAKGGTDVTISGRALRGESVMQYASRLNQAFKPYGVQFNSLELTPEAVGARGAPAPALTTVAFKLS